MQLLVELRISHLQQAQTDVVATPKLETKMTPEPLKLRIYRISEYCLQLKLMYDALHYTGCIMTTEQLQRLILLLTKL
jgi:hypothetical protein